MSEGAKNRKEKRRESYASKQSSQKTRNTLIAIGILVGVAAIVGYSAYVFATAQSNAPGGPDGAGPLGSDHAHAALLVSIFGDRFDFSLPAYQIKSSWIHFEGQDGTTIHKHATGVNLGYLFDTLRIGIDDKCYVFPDGRQFCTNEEYALRYFINDKPVNDIRDYEIMEGDRILVLYGAETPEEIEQYKMQLNAQELIE